MRGEGGGRVKKKKRETDRHTDRGRKKESDREKKKKKDDTDRQPPQTDSDNKRLQNGRERLIRRGFGYVLARRVISTTTDRHRKKGMQTGSQRLAWTETPPPPPHYPLPPSFPSSMPS